MESAYSVVVGPKPDQAFTARSFLDYLRLSNDHWWDCDEIGAQCSWVFRGHANSIDWKLIPSAARPLALNALKPLIDQLADIKLGSTEGKLDQAARMYTAYIRAISDFRNLAVELGLASFPEPVTRVNHGLQWPVPGSKTESDKAFATMMDMKIAPLAQHHGIPTFLLDWTKQPEFAAHFATSDEQLKPGTSDIAVYALNSKETRLDQLHGANRWPELLCWPLESTPRENPYLLAQSGLFTYSIGTHIHFFETGEFLSLEDLFGGAVAPKIALKKIVLKADEVPALRDLLDREAISTAHLKPTLDNVAITVRSRWNAI